MVCDTALKSKLWLSCDLCLRWHHGNCVGIKDETSKKAKAFRCKPCQSYLKQLRIEETPAAKKRAKTKPAEKAKSGQKAATLPYDPQRAASAAKVIASSIERASAGSLDLEAEYRAAFAAGLIEPRSSTRQRTLAKPATAASSSSESATERQRETKTKPGKAKATKTKPGKAKATKRSAAASESLAKKARREAETRIGEEYGGKSEAEIIAQLEATVAHLRRQLKAKSDQVIALRFELREARLQQHKESTSGEEVQEEGKAPKWYESFEKKKKRQRRRTKRRRRRR